MFWCSIRGGTFVPPLRFSVDLACLAVMGSNTCKYAVAVAIDCCGYNQTVSTAEGEASPLLFSLRYACYFRDEKGGLQADCLDFIGLKSMLQHNKLAASATLIFS